MDHADAVFKRILRRGDGHGLAVDVDLPLVGEIDAGEHVHQRGLAAAVFTEQGQDLALVQLEIDGVVCRHLSEPLCNVLHFDCAFSSQGGHPFCAGWIPEIQTRRPARALHMCAMGLFYHKIFGL